MDTDLVTTPGSEYSVSERDNGRGLNKIRYDEPIVQVIILSTTAAVLRIREPVFPA